MPSRALGTTVACPARTARAAGFGVDGVALAAGPAQLPVGPVHLDHRQAGVLQDPLQAQPVGAGALDTDLGHGALAGHPPLHAAQADRGGGVGLGAQEPAGGVDHGCDVNIFVGVDTAIDDAFLVRHAGLVLSDRSGGMHADRSGHRTGQTRCLARLL